MDQAEKQMNELASRVVAYACMVETIMKNGTDLKLEVNEKIAGIKNTLDLFLDKENKYRADFYKYYSDRLRDLEAQSSHLIFQEENIKTFWERKDENLRELEERIRGHISDFERTRNTIGWALAMVCVFGVFCAISALKTL